MNEPGWYQDAIVYEVHVRSFCDSNADGIGDFRGLTSRLDYLQELGISCLWLLPFLPSPLKADGYDTSDFCEVHADYGTLDDFDEFLRQAHRRDIRVIVELVLNHTSDEHPWFREARVSPYAACRDYYVWSDSDQKYREARIIFPETERSIWAWDPTSKAYYLHRFASQEPDLNYDHPDVRQELVRILSFWLDRGVDGLRLDAVPFLFEREGTSCEDLPETHGLMRDVRRYVDQRYPGRALLAEANQRPADMRAYFGAGDEFHMVSYLGLLTRLFTAFERQDREPIIHMLRTGPAVPRGCQWAISLHDELVLEALALPAQGDALVPDLPLLLDQGMSRRLAPLLNNGRREIELMNVILMTLPGTPVIYYGDELGMGDNTYLGRRRALRTPMQWSSDRNAGFSAADAERLYCPLVSNPVYGYQSVNVEAQHRVPSSLLNWMRQLLATRKRYRALSRGGIRLLHPANQAVLPFIREYEGERMLVVCNLAPRAQYLELDLREYDGCTPVEAFGGTSFPRIGTLPYLLTLGPYGYYWFLIAP